MRRLRPLRLAALSAVAVGGLLAMHAAIAVAADQRVTVRDFAFRPATVTVQVGDTVTWRNDAGDPEHTATADNGAWNAGDIRPGGTASVTFNTAGRFSYHCEYHPRMKGTVVVEARAGTGGQTQPQTDTAGAPNAESGDRDAQEGRSAVLVVALLAGLGGARLYLGRRRRAG
ncbi:MAG: cupredoxin family copper-binding protein [Chloroflexota bacterium]|nr:cupredoxin family copper-binding protein [Chloroflexota bacterium]